MTPLTDSSEYLLLFRGAHWDKDLSTEEVRRVMDRWMAWFERLTQAGTAKAGQPLGEEGKIVSGKNGRTVADGPFAESKEAVAGYFLLQVADLDAAVKIAQECPALEYGMVVEVRPVTECCEIRQRLNEQLTATTA